MTTHFPIELLPAHALLWQRFEDKLRLKRHGHATLFVGFGQDKLLQFAFRVSAALFCNEIQTPCGQCDSCRLVSKNQHPDLYYLRPEKLGAPIKIDQIRELSSLIYTSPQWGENRVIIIQPADKLNIQAANALLKMLEEPPHGVVFMLITERLSCLPITIISRCQQWLFPESELGNRDYLAMSNNLLEELPQGKERVQLSVIAQDLFLLCSDALTACDIGEKWSRFEFSELMRLLYLINAQMIAFYFKLFPSSLPQAEGSEGDLRKNESVIYQLSELFHPIDLYKQLDRLGEIRKKMDGNIHINQMLALENLLLGYLFSRRIAA